MTLEELISKYENFEQTLKKENVWGANERSLGEHWGQLELLTPLIAELKNVNQSLRPTIPQFVADMIESGREFRSLYGMLQKLNQELDDNIMFKQWRERITGHDGSEKVQAIVGRSYMIGYEIEKDNIETLTDVLLTAIRSDDYTGVLRNSIREFVIKNDGQ